MLIPSVSLAAWILKDPESSSGLRCAPVQDDGGRAWVWRRLQLIAGTVELQEEIMA